MNWIEIISTIQSVRAAVNSLGISTQTVKKPTVEVDDTINFDRCVDLASRRTLRANNINIGRLDKKLTR